MTEQEFQAQVLDVARLMGWQTLVVRRSIGRRAGARAWQTTTSRRGWPDVFLWHPRHGFAALELKVGRNVASPEQVEVLAELRAAGARTMVAYPSDFDAVVSMLRGERVAA